ncbi:subtilisin-like protease [Auricularia subglabra TFB-10046 SS5]|nr:subtilisin-like protease [Auricularia subglabra TFB-10046 SS5]
MRSLTSFVALSVALASGAAALKPIQFKPTLPTQGGRVIVELDAPAVNSFGKREDPHAALFERLDRRGVPWKTHQKYDSDIFTGVSVTLSSGADIAELEKLEGVKSVRPVRLFDRPRPINLHVLNGADDKNVPGGDKDSTHIMTGVDKLHKERITGKGIKIGIIDSGVDYSHPNLGGKFGPGNKVTGGYDYVGDDYTGRNDPIPDDDPMDCGGHGTHVAGIIGANAGNPYNITGVAKDAELRAYRIFGCDGVTGDDIIVEALLQAYKDKNDVITLSLGGADGWTTAASAVVASRIAQKGRVVTIAAGNSGDQGGWYTSSPGNGLDVISVSSAENTEVFYNALQTVGADHAPIPYISDGSIVPVDITGEWPIYAISTDTSVPDDACNPLPDSTPDLSTFVTVVRRGSCNFSIKLDNIAAKGGKVAVVYNNGGSFSPVNFGSTVKAVLIQDEDGAFLVDQFVKKTGAKIVFPQENAVVKTPSPTGGLISDFTSFGPSNDMYFKPAIAAPGGNIMSTYPIKKGSFAVSSGTSMACPHMAGAAALILQAKGKNANVARSLRALVETTAKYVASDKTDSAPLQTLAQQGAGLLNVYDAIRYKTVLTPGELLLNDTAHWRARHTITIKNTSQKKQTYQLTHVPAGTALTIAEGSALPQLYPIPLTNDAVGVRLSKSKVTVAPGRSAKVDITFTPPKGVDAARLPVLSGFIQVTGAGETLKASYLGLAASLKDAAVVDPTPDYFGIPTPVLLNKDMEEQTEHTNYTLAIGDMPTILFRLAMGTPLLTLDVVAADAKIETTLGSAKKVKGEGSFDKVPTVGRVGSLEYMSRDALDEDGYQTVRLAAKYENGNAVEPGDYRLLLRVLKISGDRRKEEDYEVYLSPAFSVVKA